MRFNDHVVANTLAFVLAGGAGRRLNPLTRYRPKPLVPFGGCFRLLDFTLSNCLNSGLRQAYVLTQHERESMADYLRNGWNCVAMAGCREFAIPRPAGGEKLYAGTADAVLQNLPLLQQHLCSTALVVSADHVYKMDYRNLLAFHAATGADATIATVDYPKELSSEMGVLEIDGVDRVVGFEEKPRNPPPKFMGAKTVPVNMGVYVFNVDALLAVVQANGGPMIDIARDLIPRLLGSHRVNAYRHADRPGTNPLYWRDVGTVEAYYDASMDLLASDPPMDPYDNRWPLRSAYGARLRRSALSEAGGEPGVNSIIPHATDIGGACVYRSVLSPGVLLEPGADVQNSVLLPGAVIRRGAAIRRAIIDAHVTIEAGEHIGYDTELDQSRFYILPNGIVVVPSDYRRSGGQLHAVPTVSSCGSA
jgi:glucose-1-phosphate adenylyltransferase